MNLLIKLLYLCCVLCLCTAENGEKTRHSFSGLPSNIDPLKELVKGAFLNSWPAVTNTQVVFCYCKTEPNNAL